MLTQQPQPINHQVVSIRNLIGWATTCLPSLSQIDGKGFRVQGVLHDHSFKSLYISIEFCVIFLCLLINYPVDPSSWVYSHVYWLHPSPARSHLAVDLICHLSECLHGCTVGWQGAAAACRPSYWDAGANACNIHHEQMP